MDLQALIDRQQIIDATISIAVCADHGKWDKLVSEVFADTVTVDYISLFGGESQTMSSKDLIAGWRTVLPGFECTQHLLSNHQVFITGDKAAALAYVRAHHRLPNKTGGDTWVVGGYYDYELTRSNNGWRVTLMKLNVQYTEGNQNLLVLAQEAAKTMAVNR
jgi:hypothetical protein